MVKNDHSKLINNYFSIDIGEWNSGDGARVEVQWMMLIIKLTTCFQLVIVNFDFFIIWQ